MSRTYTPIPKGSEHPIGSNAPGPWWWPAFDGDEGKTVVVLVCGGCNRHQALSQHTVDAEGKVHASILCGVGCGWHVWGQLLGWEP